MRLSYPLWTILLMLAFGGMSLAATMEPEIVEVEEAAPGEEDFYFSSNTPRTERVIAALAANPTRAKSFLVIIDHRNRVPVDEEPSNNLLGFDGGGLKIGLGLRYGWLDNLDMGIYRVNGTVEAHDVYEFDFRYRFLNQRRHYLDLAIRPGYTLFSQMDREDASGGFCQLLASRTFRQVRLGAGLLYHSDSSNDLKKDTDDDASAAVQAACEVWFHPQVALGLEMNANIAGYGSPHPQFASGLKIITHRHTFAILLSNTQYTSADSVVTNSDRDFSDIVLGFSITREISW